MTLDINKYYNIRNTLIVTYINNYVSVVKRISTIMDNLSLNNRYDFNYLFNDNSSCGKEIKIRIFIENFDISKSPQYRAEIVDVFLYEFKLFILSLINNSVDSNLKELYTYLYDNILPCDIINLGSTIEIKL